MVKNNESNNKILNDNNKNKENKNMTKEKNKKNKKANDEIIKLPSWDLEPPIDLVNRGEL